MHQGLYYTRKLFFLVVLYFKYADNRPPGIRLLKVLVHVDEVDLNQVFILISSQLASLSGHLGVPLSIP